MNFLKLLLFVMAIQNLKGLAMAQTEDTQAPPSNSKPSPEQAVDGPPNEAPYVSTEKEFDSPAPAPAPAPPASPAPPAPPAPEVSTNDKASVSSEDDKPRWIEHPLSVKGLKVIEADGSYIYKIKEEKYHHAGSFRLGLVEPPKITSVDGTTDFANMYGDQKIPFFMYDIEWHPFGKFGKLGIKGGLGFFTAQGLGRFTVPDPLGRQPKEKYTFLALPINLGVVYRLEYGSNQWFAPYLTGGGSYYLLGELRDDSKTKRFLGSAAAYGGGGVLLNMAVLDRDLTFRLQNEYDVGTLWMNFEYRYIASVSKELDMSGSIFSFGFSMDY